MSDITEEQIQQWRNERIKRVNDGIEAILRLENCELHAIPIITSDGRIAAQIAIVPK